MSQETLFKEKRIANDGDMTSPKRYDLEERTAAFAKAVRDFVKAIRLTSLNTDDVRQLIRSSGSVAANYVEANDCLGKGDLAMRIRICRKESKESRLWLQLIEVPEQLEHQKQILTEEARQLMCIFGSILVKVQK